jgi:flagellar biosynthetic protein FliR
MTNGIALVIGHWSLVIAATPAMPSLIQSFLDQFLLFTLVLTRVSGLFMTLPVFGTQAVPLQFRGLAAVSIALLITPSFWGTAPPEPGNVVGLLVVLGREAVLGLALGLSVNILFSGMQLAGQVIAQISGLSLADVFNPQMESNVPVFAQLLDATALAVFVCIGGHREVIDALLDTFHTMPPGQAEFAPTLVDALTLILSNSFLTGIRASAPVMVSLLLAVLIVGLISRTLPQLNTINLGFSLNTLVLLGVLAFSLGSAVWIFQDETQGAIEAVQGAMTKDP